MLAEALERLGQADGSKVRGVGEQESDDSIVSARIGPGLSKGELAQGG